MARSNIRFSCSNNHIKSLGAKNNLWACKAANRRWPPYSEQVWVFPSRQHGKPIAEPRSILETHREEMGLWITAHDLRR